jgi:hypothetical protein
MAEKYDSIIADLPADRKVFIVFRGIPEVIYIKEGRDNMDAAQLAALCITEDTGDDATYMIVPTASLSYAMFTRNHGIVTHALQEELDGKES